jgi:hypothetical protein
MSESKSSRRRWLLYSVGTGIGLYLLGAATDRAAAPPYPQLSVPAGYPPRAAQRIQNLHARYSTLRTTGGVPAVRQRIIADLHGFRGYEEWLEAVVEWIQLAGWNDAADLLIDAAEIGGPSVRQNAAALLAGRATSLLATNGYGPRVVRLHQTEADAAAKDDWRALRRLLGV